MPDPEAVLDARQIRKGLQATQTGQRGIEEVQQQQTHVLIQEEIPVAGPVSRRSHRAQPLQSGPVISILAGEPLGGAVEADKPWCITPHSLWISLNAKHILCRTLLLSLLGGGILGKLATSA